MNYGYVTLKLISAFIILLVYINLSGRSQLAPMTPSDQIGNMVIGALAGSLILSNDVSVWASIVVVSIWAALQIIIRFLKYKYPKVAEILNGKQIQLIKDGKFYSENFGKARLDLNDFIISIQQQGVKHIDELENAWFEPSGQIAIDKKDDLSHGIVIVSNGKLNKTNLALIKQTQQKLKTAMKNAKFSDITDVFYCEWYDDNFWFYPYEDEKAA